MSEEVGIRELRQNLSVYLRRVMDGEHFTVTQHNLPVARLVPLVEPPETWEQVKQRLNIRPAKKDPLAIWDRPRLGPRVRKAGEPTLDDILDELREDRL